jgi:hypothetical protein
LAGIVADARRTNPNAFDPNLIQRDISAGRAVEGPAFARRGWVEPSELRVPPGTGAIEQLTAATPKELLVQQLKALSSDQRKELLRQIAESKDPRSEELKALAEDAWGRR